MLSKAVVAFLMAAGGGAWVYGQMQRRSGVRQTSITVALGAAILLFIITLVIAARLLPGSTTSGL